MTNLLATILVTLVTNVTERFPQHYEPLPAPWRPGGSAYTLESYGHYVDDPSPAKKWVRTTVKRVTKAKFEWGGKPREVSEEEVVSDVEVEMRRNELWSAVATNEVPQTLFTWYGGDGGALTNFATTNAIGMILIATNAHLAKEPWREE